MFHERFIGFSMRYPRAVVVVIAVMTIAAASFVPRIQIDTDPENMLPPHQAARVFHNEVKKDFTLWDMIVVGVVNEKHPDGIFNPTTLTRVHDLTNEIQKIDGVIRQDLMSLSSIDNISQDGPGVVPFEWMMAEAPGTPEEAHAIRDGARRLPTIDGTIVSEDNRVVGIYVPIEDKNEGPRIATEIDKVIAGYTGDEEYFITGLPVAEDTFGVVMFRQMGIAAPLAGLIIFLLMWFFFRFKPMLYTSLTSAAGFASLAFAPIPPVRIFGIFVAIGILLAFLLTIVFIPAYVVRLSDARIAKLKRGAGAHAHDNHPLARLLRGLGPRTLAGSKLIVAVTLVILVVSVVGISRIQINDNPVRWFRPDHRIRVADRVLNKHFGGTYNAFLVLEKAEDRVSGRPSATLIECDLVGKTTSLADIVKTVHRELREGDGRYYSIPGTSNAVAQTLLSYQSSHRPT